MPMLKKMIPVMMITDAGYDDDALSLAFLLGSVCLDQVLSRLWLAFAMIPSGSAIPPANVHKSCFRHVSTLIQTYDS